MGRHRATLSVALLAGALAVGACGGDDVVTDTDGTLQLVLDEFRVEPGALRVPAGRLRLVARNEGVLPHNIAVVTAPDPGDDEEELGRTDTAFPGAIAREREPIMLTPGRYRLICTLANHDNLGQYAELEVVEASAR